MPRKLKVYRTAIGFHDAYVAVPSQKAALAAWGTDKDLFARGAAELVTDPVLTEAPLARPGEVIRVVRGSATEHVRALGATSKPKAEPAAPPRPSRRETSAPAKPKRPPRPSREPVDLAKRAMRAAEKRIGDRLDELARREQALAAERRRIEREIAEERQRHESRLRRAEESYSAELEAWSAFKA